MTAAHAERIAGWTYPGEYAVYSFARDEETVRELLDGSYFARLAGGGELTGYYCFGASARIPEMLVGLDVTRPGAAADVEVRTPRRRAVVTRSIL